MISLRIEALHPAHETSRFECGEPALDDYLRQRASQHVRRRVAQVFVAVAPQATEVLGYYAVSAASFDRDDRDDLAPEVARRLPHYPVPAALIGRLAADRKTRGQRVGEFLLLDALHRVRLVSASLGVHAVVVDALHVDAARFYARYGFQPFPSQPLRLFLPLKTIEKAGL